MLLEHNKAVLYTTQASSFSTLVSSMPCHIPHLTHWHFSPRNRRRHSGTFICRSSSWKTYLLSTHLSYFYLSAFITEMRRGLHALSLPSLTWIANYFYYNKLVNAALIWLPSASRSSLSYRVLQVSVHKDKWLYWNTLIESVA